MSINVNDKNLGHATAYAYYKAGGGTMTEAEFTEFMADFGTASQTAVEAAQAALASKNAAQTAATTATNKASEATTAATTATNKAAEAQADADAAALDASQAMSAASTATSKATEATTAAATATSAKTDAVAANTAAQSAKTAAQTAQTGAETAAASVQSSAAQIATNTENITQLKSELSDIEFAIGGKEKKPNIVKGVFTYSFSDSRMGWNSNNARATADLRYLNLEQGDTVGIVDYETYSIAFGDNGHGWYGGGYQTTDVTANDTNIQPWIILIKRNDGTDMTDADLQALTDQFHASKSVTALPIRKVHNGYVHLSFDDVGYCIGHLQTGGVFASIWDEPFFGMLKNLHEKYGAVFSLYVWDIANVANIPSRFKKDFMDASDWLKFGFHATQEGSLANTSYADAKTEYGTFITNVFNKIGGINSVDRIPRLNYFAGNLDALKGLRDADCGCIGFLNTDDTRSAYYLTDEELTYLRTHSLWSDRANGLQFVSTVLRLDWFVSGFSSDYEYNVPVKDNPYDELVYRYGQPTMADLYSSLIVFTHEWQTYSSSYVLNTAMVERLEQVCKFANDYGYDFDYPQNRIPNITSVYIGEQTINNFVTTVKGEWSFGAVEDSGNIVSSTTRICTAPFKASKVVVDFPSGYKVNVCRYNSQTANSDSYVGRTDWQTTKQTVTGDYYYVIVASTTSNTATLDIADNYTITAVRNINDL